MIIIQSLKRPLFCAAIVSAVLVCLSIPVPAATLQDVLNKHIEAMGGKEALAAIRSAAAYAAVDYMGMTGTEVSLVKFPAKYFVAYDLKVAGQKMGFDGITGWMTDPNGIVRESGAEELRPMINDLYFTSYAYILAGRLPGRVEYHGDTVITLKTFHCLALCPEGGDSLTLLINAANGLPEYRFETMMGLKAITTYSDFRPVAGVMTPFAIDMTTPGAPYHISGRIDSIRVNPDLPDSIFAMPGASRADFVFPVGADSIVVSCPVVDNHLFVTVRVNGRGPFRFLLDSGAGSTVLSLRVANQLGIPVSGGVPARGVGGFGALGFGAIDSITIDQLTLQYSKIMVADFDSLAGGMLADLDGVLGYDFFARFPVRIDFAGSGLIIYRPDLPPKDIPGNQLPLDIYCQLPIINGALDGQPIRLAIDLGAQSGLMVQYNSRTYGLVRAREKKGTPTTKIGGVGGAKAVHTAVLDSLRIGTVLITAPSVMAPDDFSGMPFPDYIEGIVGIDILKKFDLYMDYGRGKFRLETSPR